MNRQASISRLLFAAFLGNVGMDALFVVLLPCAALRGQQAVQWLATGRLSLEGRKVRVSDAGLPKAAVRGALVNPPLEEGF